MTAHELARKLLAGEDLPVTVRGYEGGVDTIGTVCEPARLCLNKNEAWYYGKHEYEYSHCGDTTHEYTMAIHLEGE